MAPSDTFHAAVVEAAMSKTDICWVRWDGESRDHPVWHVWHDGAAYVLSGPGEQPLPGAGTAERAAVTARTKDSRARLIVWEAGVTRVSPGSPEWEDVAPLLRGGRLNLLDPEHAAQRWGRDCVVLRFTPTGEVSEAPGGYRADDQSAAPLPTRATTRGRLPRVLHRRQSRGPRLS